MMMSWAELVGVLNYGIYYKLPYLNLKNINNQANLLISLVSQDSQYIDIGNLSKNIQIA